MRGNGLLSKILTIQKTVDFGLLTLSTTEVEVTKKNITLQVMLYSDNQETGKFANNVAHSRP